MPRKLRFIVPDVPVHIVQRGHEPVFFEDADYQAYFEWLKIRSRALSCCDTRFVLMTNHIHILPESSETDSASLKFF